MQAAKQGYHQQAVVEEHVAELRRARDDVGGDCKCNRQEYYGYESYTPQSRDKPFVDFSFINFVKKFASVCNQKYLRYQHAGEQYAQRENY